MCNLNAWGGTFVGSIQGVWQIMLAYLPQIIGAILVLVIGLILANLLGKFAKKLVGYTRVDNLSHKIGLKEELDKMGFSFTFEDLIGQVVKWFLIIATFIAIVDILNFPQLTGFLERVALYIPNVIVAIAILAIGLIVGRLVYNFIQSGLGATSMTGVSVAFMAALAKWAIYAFAFMAMLVQLGIAPSLVQILFTGLVVMFSLAGGLAFGLGGRDKAARILDWVEKEISGKDRGPDR